MKGKHAATEHHRCSLSLSLPLGMFHRQDTSREPCLSQVFPIFCVLTLFIWMSGSPACREIFMLLPEFGHSFLCLFPRVLTSAPFHRPRALLSPSTPTNVDCLTCAWITAFDCRLCSSPTDSAKYHLYPPSKASSTVIPVV